MDYYGEHQSSDTAQEIPQALLPESDCVADPLSPRELELLRQLQTANAVNAVNGQILAAAGEGIYSLDDEGRNTFTNPAAEALTGWTAAELFGKSQHATLHHSYADGTPYPIEVCPIHMALRDGRIHHSDSEVFWRKDGTCFPVSYTSTPILRDGIPSGVVVLFQDITKRKREQVWETYKISILRALTNHLELETLLDLTANVFVELYPSCSIAFFERRQKSLKLMAHTRIPGSLQHSLTIGDSGETISACALAAERGTEILATRNPQPQTPQTYTELEESPFTSCLAVPFFSASGDVAGVVAFFSSDEASVDVQAREHVSRICDITRLAIEQQQLYANLLHQSQHDHLTGLPNRLLMEDRLELTLMQARRHGTQVGVCYMDLDKFKQINDTLGHSTGDAVLQHVSNILTSSLRETDIIARQGGDEFILILPDIQSESEADIACGRIMALLRQPFKIGEHAITPTASIGISIYPAHGDTSLTLMQNADFALFVAKQSGRDKVQRFDSKLGENMRRSSELQRELRFALELDQFSIAYQPLYCRDRHLKGFEALLRWSHPTLGQVGPDHFIPIAEESGLILPIGEWVLNEACRQAQEWNTVSDQPVKIFVNVSCVQLSHPNFTEVVANALEKSGLATNLLELEITETWIVVDPKAAAQRLSELRRLGVSISIDDFGSGHSSFSYLQQLPVDTIKLDRSFISYLDGTQKNSAIIRAVVSLAEELGMQTVAEGIETESQFGELQCSQCSLFQGYLFAHPLTPAKARLLITNGDHHVIGPN